MLFLGFFQVVPLALVLFSSRRGALYAALLGAFFPFVFHLPLTATFLFGAGPLLAWTVGYFFRRMESAFLKERGKRLQEAEERFRQKKKDLEKKETSRQTLEQRVGEIVTLYELTKRVTTSLELSEIFLLLQEALQSHLSFEKGWLLLVAEKEPIPTLEGSYQFLAGQKLSLEEARVSPLPPFQEKLVEEMTRQRRPLRLEEGKMAVPLIVKNELNGMLILDRFSHEQEESLLILASQFSPAIQKVKLYETIQQLAITDGLTRLFSRHYFLERFHEELTRSKRYRLSLAFLMADIDHFKEHNDRCGHLVGDVVLREVASVIKGNVREIDLVGRYGGEEFAVVLPDTPLEGALHVAQRIRSSMESHPFVAYDEVLHVTISLGISLYPENGEDPVTLIDVADSALYHAKRAGRNRVSTSRLAAGPA